MTTPDKSFPRWFRENKQFMKAVVGLWKFSSETDSGTFHYVSGMVANSAYTLLECETLLRTDGSGMTFTELTPQEAAEILKEAKGL